MADIEVTSVGGLDGDDGPNTLRLYPDTLLYQLTAAVNALRANGVLAIGTLAISGADATTFKTTTTARYRIDGIQYSKDAADEIEFSEADTINTGEATGFFWGVWLVQIDAAGAISTVSPSADQVYASEADAIAALPEADEGNVAIGYITVAANEDVDWVANTDDLTDESDCLEANFYDIAALDNAGDRIVFSTGVAP